MKEHLCTNPRIIEGKVTTMRDKTNQREIIGGKGLKEAVTTYQKVLDDLVSVNSLFTVGMFIGLSFASTENQNIEGLKNCEVGLHVKRRLVKNEVISFALYLFSSLVAKALKTHLSSYAVEKKGMVDFDSSREKAVRVVMFSLSTWSSIIGYVLLLRSMVDLIQIRLGIPSCGGSYTTRATQVLIAFNSLALCIYVPSVLVVACSSGKNFQSNRAKSGQGS